MRQTRAFPELATAPHTPLELFTEGFDGTAAQGSAFVFPVLIVDVLLMLTEVVHFPGDDLLGFLGPFGLGFEQVLEPVDDERFLAVAQRFHPLRHPVFGPLGFPSVEGFSDRVEMLPVERHRVFSSSSPVRAETISIAKHSSCSRFSSSARVHSRPAANTSCSIRWSRFKASSGF